MTLSGASPRQARRLTPLLTLKGSTRIGTWNVRTLYEVGKAAQVVSKIRQYNISVLAICESRWNGAGQVTLAIGERLLYSGHEEEQHAHVKGVALMLSESAAKALIECNPVSPRILMARFNSKGRKVAIINCYAPTNNTADGQKEEFYGSLQVVLDHAPRRDIKILLGNFNAKICHDNTGKERAMRRQGSGCMRENGERAVYRLSHWWEHFPPQCHSQGHVDLPGWTNFKPRYIDHITIAWK